MKITERNFDSVRLEPGTYTVRVDNPKFDDGTGTKPDGSAKKGPSVSIRATVTEGEFAGSWISDYYQLTRDNGATAPNFGITKMSAMLNAIGIEKNQDFEDREAMDAYILEMEGKLNEFTKLPGLLDKMEGMMFVATVKKNKEYLNIVNYAPLGESKSGKKDSDTSSDWGA